MPQSKVLTRLSEWGNHLRVMNMAREVAAHSPKALAQQPIAFFNASARITGLSQNAAFSLLSSWGLRLAGVPVYHFVCQRGMSHCVLGTNRDNYQKAPPCQSCIRQSKRLHLGAETYWFDYQKDHDLADAINHLSVEEMSTFEYGKIKGSLVTPGITLPLGQLVLPSLRWALRRHTLIDNPETRYLLKEYIFSAYNVAKEFSAFLDRVKPATAIIFNGMMYPEAVARWIAKARGLRVITYEVGFQQYSAFFTEGDATAYPITVPSDFELSADQNERLDRYLEGRFHGQFTMAGIRFWPEIRGLGEEILQKTTGFQQVVSVFTNVVFDTSQAHANTTFPDMFVWLDQVLEIIRAHPETLFVIRAHPDEMRPGTAKQSRESVRQWVTQTGADALSNVTFIDSQEYTSSYELVQRSKFVMIYNSSIGLEATLLGVPVLCAGKARFTQLPIVFYPSSREEYLALVEDLLGQEKISIPTEFRQNARRFIYCQLFRSSLSFEDYLEEGHRKGYVHLKKFSWEDLLPQNSTTIQVLMEGINGLDPSQNPRLRTAANDETSSLFQTDITT